MYLESRNGNVFDLAVMNVGDWAVEHVVGTDQADTISRTGQGVLLEAALGTIPLLLRYGDVGYGGPDKDVLIFNRFPRSTSVSILHQTPMSFCGRLRFWTWLRETRCGWTESATPALKLYRVPLKAMGMGIVAALA